MSAFRKLLLLAASSGLISVAHADYANGIKAIVQNAVITLAEVEQYAKPAAEALLRQYRGQPQTFQQKLAAEMDKGLEELIERQLVLFDFRSAGYNFPEAIIDDEVEDRIRSQYGDDQDRGRLPGDPGQPRLDEPVGDPAGDHVGEARHERDRGGGDGGGA